MTTIELDLDGYTDLPPGRIANVVTYLERFEPPAGPRADLPEGYALLTVEAPDADAYIALYRRIGQEWLWFSRAVMPREALAALLAAPSTELLFLMRGDEPMGLCEIQRSGDDVEIAMFGVVPEATGAGVGKAFMAAALERIWTEGTRRVWLHTCTFDHPAAVHFYRRMGFTPYKFAIEVARDPRLDGLLPETAGTHVPLIREK